MVDTQHQQFAMKLFCSSALPKKTTENLEGVTKLNKFNLQSYHNTKFARGFEIIYSLTEIF